MPIGLAARNIPFMPTLPTTQTTAFAAAVFYLHLLLPQRHLQAYAYKSNRNVENGDRSGNDMNTAW